MRIGERVRQYRRAAGLTQEGLAERAGVSVDLVRKLEQGSRNTARMATLHALARAVGVSTSALLGSAGTAVAAREADRDELALLGMRRELNPVVGLMGHGQPVAIEPVDQAVLARAIRDLDRRYHGDDYALVLDALPGLLAQARAGVDAATGDERAAALSLLASAHQLAGTTLIQVRSLDLAHRALTIAADAARAAGDDLTSASVVTTLCWLLLRESRYPEAEALAVATADSIEPGFGPGARPAALGVWGWLFLRAAAATARDNRSDDATDMLGAATAAAARIGHLQPEDVAPGPTTIGAFGPTVVAMKAVEAAAVVNDPGRALALAGTIHLDATTTSDNRHRHLLDVAWAHAERRAWTEATSVLATVRAEAPTWLRHQRYAADIVDTIKTSQRRRPGTELAGLIELFDPTS